MTQEPTSRNGSSAFDLTGKHALVTAAGSNLGRALAVALAEAGARVSVTTLRDEDREEPAVHSVLNECWSLGREGAMRRVDLAAPASVEAAVASLEEEVGPIDILVNAPHVATVKPLTEITLPEWRREMDANVTSMFVATRALGPRMIARHGGRVLNVVSVLAERGVPNAALFGATQGAVLAFTRSLGLEWGFRGVSVNALGVGFIDGLPGPHADPEAAAVLERYIPVRRLGTVEDLQGAAVFLASSASSYVNAELVLVDGAIATHA